MSLPEAVHVRLCDREALADNFQHMSRTLVHPVRAEEDCGNTISAHVLQRLCRNGMAEQAIHHQFSAYTDRQKDAGIGTARPHRIDEVSLSKDHRLTREEVRCGHREWNPQLLECLYFKDSVQETGHAVVGTQTEAGNGVAGEVFKANDGGDFFEFFGRDAAAIRGADYGANAGSRYKVGDDAFFFQSFENANVRKSARESAAEGESDATGFWRIKTRLMRALDLSCQSSHGLMQAVEEFHWAPRPSRPGRLGLRLMPALFVTYDAQVSQTRCSSDSAFQRYFKGTGPVK